MSATATQHDAETLRTALAELDQPCIQASTERCTFVGGLHLAVMTGPFLEWIASGRKTVESRFHQQQRSPLFRASTGDVVVFRQSGRPATLAAVLGQVSYLDLAEIDLNQVRTEWAQRIACDDDEFWRARSTAKWVSLLELSAVFSIPPQSLRKRDRQGWVTYPPVGSSPSVVQSEVSAIAVAHDERRETLPTARSVDVAASPLPALS